ncbi:MAG: hypothetical protein D6738_15255 [Acidobacteria bacterium]|nr:MAG: hypothetical protein D6738_15255 [Acidobacteriota bacterium]
MSGGRRRVIACGVLDTLADLRGALDRALAEDLGVRAAAQRARILAGRDEAEDELLDSLEQWRPCREIVAESLAVACRREGLPAPAAALERVAARLGALEPLDDARRALPGLARAGELALVSALDPEDLAAFAGRLPVPVAHAVSARAVGAYPPEPDPLLALLHEMALDEDELLFVSARAERELYTAQDLGIEAAYVDRDGAGIPDELEVAHHVASLEALSRRLTGRRRRRRAPPRA